MNILSHYYHKVLILIQVPDTYFPHMLNVVNFVSVLTLDLEITWQQNFITSNEFRIALSDLFFCGSK